MNKILVIGILAIIISIAFAPCINANIDKASDEDIKIYKKVESKTNHITPYIYDIFIFGKVSNVRMGGFTPSYWFHIDKVMTYGNQQPRVIWIEDREGFMLSMDFIGFVFKNIIIGIVSSLLIYD